MRVRRVIVVGAVLVLTACTSQDSSSPGDPTGGADGASPQAAAQVYADALASGDFAEVSFADGGDPAAVAEEYAATVEGLGRLTPTVSVADVAEKDGPDGPTATATLDWTWPIGPDGWEYSSQATLTQLDDEWQTTWDVATVEPSLSPKVTLDLVSLGAKRGDIMGGGGLALVTNRPVVRVGIDRSKVGAGKAGASARDVARLVGIDPAAYAKRVQASGPLAFVEAIVFRQDEVPPGVLHGMRGIKGGAVIAGEIPLAPTKGFAAPILGSVGEVTADMIEKDPTLEVGDVAGLSGLQARYDEQLRGTPGQEVNAVGADGKTREIFRVDAIDGQNLELTLDERLQIAAEQALAGVGPASALVANRPSTGAILAAANGPGNGGQNLATYGQYAPGSTFKSVSSLALLRAGDTPVTIVPCTSSVVVDGKRFENYDDYPASALGDIPLRTAVASSCNTAFISQRGKLGQTSLVEAAASLGMGVDHDLGFPAYFGNVVPPAGETEKAADLIGQGKILASPMSMATVIASIESGGLVVPQLVKSVPSTPPEGVSGPTAAEAGALRGLLRGVVTSGSGSFLLDVPGPPVIAKTGTAEFDRGGRILTHAWMIAAQGDLAVAVFVDEGSSGSGTAGPLLEQFLRAQ
ncbi:MAG: penicillin-binding transpeptidase domain-containing protein [Nocardioides sp.]